MDKKISPCGDCTRVRDPRNCDNKDCMLWRQWYIGRWEAMRSAVRSAMDVAPEKVGAVVSGTHYAAPNQVELYLRTDPCGGCLCPRDLCKSPCAARKNWDKARQEVGL